MWKSQNAAEYGRKRSLYLHERENESGEFKRFKVIGNNTVDLQYYIKSDPKEIGITEKCITPFCASCWRNAAGIPKS